jgi:hypothetical protein
MRYNEYRYLWPPRPEKAIPPTMLAHYENRGWLAQVKMNGTCNVLAISPERKIVAMSRHKEPHKLWTPNEDSERAFKNLPGNGWYVFIGELLHSKVADPSLKNINYLHDILVADGEMLNGKTYDERLTLLANLFLTQIDNREQPLTVSHLEIDANTWMAKSWGTAEWLFKETAAHKEMEGVVLKDPKAKLALCVKADSNSSWQVKCRKPTKAYSF